MRSKLGTIRRGSAACAALVLLWLSAAVGEAADLIFIAPAGHPTPEQHEMEIAAQFYGLNLDVVTVDASHAGAVIEPVKEPATIAVAIEADMLAMIDQRALLRALQRKPGTSVPLLILGITAQTDVTLLKRWAGVSKIDVQSVESPSDLSYVVGQVAGVTQQLSGAELPFPGKSAFYFILDQRSQAQKVVMVRKGGEALPVFIEANLGQQKVFLLGRTHSANNTPAQWSTDNVVEAFSQVAPLMMFVKHSAGAQAWHSVGHYANLTIDDPWLREPYGNLDYQGLLQEMEKHSFHTTIAFIPWNYDRSETAVVSLFRNYPDRWSICVHGNNHDHKEFEDLKSRPLGDQVADLKQALARMNRFQALTGIPFDKVFVFPHSIGPEPTLEKLKEYNYLATVNSSNVPMESTRPASLLFALRPITMRFGNFPSLMRYSAAMEKPAAFIAVNDFLDNPLLFYTHQEFFADGIDSFDEMADDVNRIDAATAWVSLGDIAKHLYLLRQRPDSNYDVLAYSSEIVLKNTSTHDVVFYVKKPGAARETVASVNVDGRAVPFQTEEGMIGLSVAIPVGGTRSIAIDYKNDLDLAAIGTANDSLRVYFLRKASDFRDIVLSQYRVGDMLTAFYYKNDGAAVRNAVYILIALLCCISAAGGALLALRKHNHAEASLEK